ncbi:MAG: alpha/beta hydrolase [Deltaproteobacteria bacterium]|nr:alpha/beta hydrolase [Deltaproteobacteria bacterium]
MKTVEANGIQICYDELGAGPPLILIMGIGCQLIHWREDLRQHFVDQGFRVIRFDNRDSGESTHFRDLRAPSIASMSARRAAGLPIEAPYLLSDMAADVIGLMDALNIDKATIMGASMGGMIAQTMAARYPDRVQAMISVMSHTGERRFLIGRPEAMKVMLNAKAPTTPEEAGVRVETIMNVLAGSEYPSPAEDYHDMGRRAFLRSNDPPAFGRQLAAILASGDRAAEIRKIGVPTLVIHGTHDPLIPVTAGRRTAALIKNAELWEVPKMGHNIPKQLWPQFVQRIDQFLRESGAVQA